GGSEVDALRACGCRGEYDLGTRDGELRAMVLPYAEERQPDLVGEARLIDDVANGPRVADALAVVVVGDVAERVEAELDGVGHAGRLSFKWMQRQRSLGHSPGSRCDVWWRHGHLRGSVGRGH